jgi:hypothetical protein
MLTHTQRITTLAALLLSSIVTAQSLTHPTGAKSVSMARALTGEYHTWAIAHNPAGSAKVTKAVFAIDYENRFLVPELSVRSATATLPSSSGNFALLYSSFGPSHWNESHTALSYSRFLGKQISCGLTFDYFRQKLPETGKSASAIGFGLGTIVHVSPDVRLGFCVKNPFSQPIGYPLGKAPIPWKVHLGGTAKISPTLILVGEITKEKSQKAVYQLGSEWNLVAPCYLRWGIDSQTRFSAGLGFVHHLFQFDIAFSYHSFLGYTPTISLQIELP